MLDKMHAVKDKSQSIGEFLDLFLPEQGITLCTFREAGNNGEPPRRWKRGVKKAKLDGLPTSRREPRIADVLNEDAEQNPEYCEWPDEYLPVHKSIEQLLADYFEIDLKVVENERRAILESLRQTTPPQVPSTSTSPVVAPPSSATSRPNG